LITPLVLYKTKCKIDFVFVCFPIGVADTDQSTGPKMTSVSHPEKVKKALTADHHHKVIIKFSVKDKASGEKVNLGFFLVFFERKSFRYSLSLLRRP
jgi:hypothetical protein